MKFSKTCMELQSAKLQNILFPAVYNKSMQHTACRRVWFEFLFHSLFMRAATYSTEFMFEHTVFEITSFKLTAHFSLMNLEILFYNSV